MVFVNVDGVAKQPRTSLSFSASGPSARVEIQPFTCRAWKRDLDRNNIRGKRDPSYVKGLDLDEA